MGGPRGTARLDDAPAANVGRRGRSPRLSIPARGQTLLTVYCFCAVVLTWVVVTSQRADRPIRFFMSDPAAVLSDDECSWDCSYAGIVSNLGALGWMFAATGCFLVAALLARLGGPPPLRSPFLWAGVLTMAALVDDFFMVHEFLWFRGVHELWVYGAIAAGAVAYAAVFHGFLRRTDIGLLLLVVGLFAISVITDALVPDRHLIEDGAKFVGIATWSVYIVGTGIAAVRLALEEHAPRSARRAPAEATADSEGRRVREPLG